MIEAFHLEILIRPIHLPLGDLLAFLVRMFARSSQRQALPSVQTSVRTSETCIGAQAWQ